MSSLPSWWSRLPWPVRWTGGILLTIGIYAAAYAALSSALDLDPDEDDLLIRLLLVVVAVPITVIGVFHQRRRLGGKGQLRLYRRAYRSGTIPEGANVDKWRPVASKQARYFREGRKVQRIFWGVLLALITIGVVVATVTQGPIGLWGLVLVVIAALVMWGLDRLWGWRQRQFDRLASALQDPSPAQA